MAKSAPTPTPVDPERFDPADYGRRRVTQGDVPTPAPMPVPADPIPE